MDNQAIESIKQIIVIRIVVITSNELVMSTKFAKTTSINKSNVFCQNNIYITIKGIITYTKLLKNKIKLKPIRTQHKFLAVSLTQQN